MAARTQRVTASLRRHFSPASSSQLLFPRHRFSSTMSTSITTSSPPPRIAIAGAGPAGLTLATLLHKHSIPFTVFELRPEPTPEEWAIPSGMFDLHEPDGLVAIRECGIYDEFLTKTAECTQETIIADKEGNKLHVSGADGGTSPEISRNNLSQLLLAQIPYESVQWGHKLLAATQKQGSSVTELDFGEGRKHEFDFVVGADGAWSKIRSLVTDVRPEYSDTQIVTVTIRNITKNFPHLAKLVGSGSFSSLGNRQAIVSQRGPIDSARLYLWLRTTDEHFGCTTGLATRPASEAKTAILESDEFLGSFGPVIKDLVGTAMEQETLDNPDAAGLDVRPLYALPYGTAWSHRPGVAVIGDAAHVMLPNGEGVNQAMFDATLLSKAIVTAYGQCKGGDATAFEKALSPLVEAFEREMTERAVETGQQTEDLLGMMLGGDDAALEMKKFFVEHGQ